MDKNPRIQEIDKKVKAAGIVAIEKYLTEMGWSSHVEDLSERLHDLLNKRNKIQTEIDFIESILGYFKQAS